MEAIINNYCDPELKVTAHVSHPDYESGDRFLGCKDLEIIFVPKQTAYRKETIGKYQFDYFFVRCFRDGIESWLSLDQLKRIFEQDSVLTTAELISGKTFTIRTTKELSIHNNYACEVKYFSIVNIK